MSDYVTSQPLTTTTTTTKSGVGSALALIYGLVAYAVFLVAFLYAIGFIGNLIVPKSIDTGGAVVPLQEALIVNVLLMSVFAIQHSLMARPEFKRQWTKIVPKAIERSTYVLFASLALLLMYWQWRPIPDVVWSVESGIGRHVLNGLYVLGWLIVFLSTFMINHFDLFGLRQVYLNLRNREHEELGFRTPFFYKFLRHPIMLGFIIAFWSTPTMTVGHLLFAVVTTVYILIAIQLEERDLVGYYGDKYREYRRKTPMLIPRPPKKG
ncbi:MAG TPA: isoprenylcysteine carboxylmethyltransferase family protein [Oceanobacillus sp.]|nr:isoprenylcysteine carboxylmethyltransferase family protein [Oceanobacillus sp.]